MNPTTSTPTSEVALPQEATDEEIDHFIANPHLYKDYAESLTGWTLDDEPGQSLGQSRRD